MATLEVLHFGVLAGDASCTFFDFGHFAALRTGDIPILFGGVVFSGIEPTGDKVSRCVAVFGPLTDIELGVAYGGRCTGWRASVRLGCVM